MRLVIAIQLNEEAKQAIEDVQEVLRWQNIQGKYSPRENLHVTLAFIGEYGDPDNVLDVMEDTEFNPFTISLDKVGDFGELFWAGISDSPELTNYVKRLRKGLADAGIPFDRKKFSPHITLVRKPIYKNWHYDRAPKGNMTVDCISLMKSERGKNGMIYTELGCIEGK